mmetsp:Transcript_123798/g.361457  ORF Transcript_123798/g.361457 Transcript_123798/m.361457 type:complete len:178 (+) Transcript_123798:54-587(+)
MQRSVCIGALLLLSSLLGLTVLVSPVCMATVASSTQPRGGVPGERRLEVTPANLQSTDNSTSNRTGAAMTNVTEDQASNESWQPEPFSLSGVADVEEAANETLPQGGSELLAQGCRYNPCYKMHCPPGWRTENTCYKCICVRPNRRPNCRPINYPCWTDIQCCSARCSRAHNCRPVR